MPQLHVETTRSGVVIAVKAVPASSRDQIAGLLGDALKVKVAAPPEGGKANLAICRLIASLLGVPTRDVTVVAGQSHANKRIAVAGVTESQVRSRLGPG
jgi:uncharacterized protein (TIGR00251 family)